MQERVIGPFGAAAIGIAVGATAFDVAPNAAEAAFTASGHAVEDDAAPSGAEDDDADDDDAPGELRAPRGGGGPLGGKSGRGTWSTAPCAAIRNDLRGAAGRAGSPPGAGAASAALAAALTKGRQIADHGTLARFGKHNFTWSSDGFVCGMS